MVEATFEQAYPIAVRAAKVRATAAVVSGAIPVADREDFEQEGLTACWRALPQFDPGRASLRTFIERVIASRISTLVRTARRSPVHLPLDEAGPRLVDSEARAREFEIDMDRVGLAHKFRDEYLLFLLLQGYSRLEAGQKMGLPPSTVQGRILRLRRILSDAGFGPNGEANASPHAFEGGGR